MISKAPFEQWMGMLGERFNKVLSPPMHLVYYDAFNAELTTDEFIAGAKLIIRDNTYFPSPKELIDKVKPAGDPALEGADVFRDILTWCGVEHLMAEARLRLTDIGMRAFLAVGGSAKFRSLLATEEPFIRRDFVTAYVAAKRDAREQAQVDRTLDKVHTRQQILPPKAKQIAAPQHIGDGMGEAMTAISGGR